VGIPESSGKLGNAATGEDVGVWHGVCNPLALDPPRKGDSPMADPTRNEGVLDDAAKLAAAARDRGIEQLEGAKGQLAEGAERMAAAVERTADELEGDGDDAISGYGHSLASLMRQLAGGLRERDIAQFANELGSLARRNPGAFLAGSVALGFGVARFFKARTAQPGLGYDNASEDRSYDRRQRNGGTLADREEFDADESLDLSGNPDGVERREDNTEGPRWTTGSDASAGSTTGAEQQSASGAELQSATGADPQSQVSRGDERGQSKSRAAKSKAKQQRSTTDAAAKESTDAGGKES
jgi:hypothetical protein